MVEAGSPEEAAKGRHDALENRLSFSSRTLGDAKRPISLLPAGDVVRVVSMAPEAAREHEILVSIPRRGRSGAVSLAQLNAISVGEETRQAIDDSRCWMGQGRERQGE
ncbi:MAG: calcium-binding protein [Thermomicrobiales bacterium]|nr:calcium-binding protein [Thermomicrobiales bacterium]